MKILAIDDNADNLTTLKAIAGDALPACVVLTALRGDRGIELALAEDPDVILLDIVMPGMDGFEVCRRLKADAQTSAIPVVFVTALQASRESRVKALEVGAEAFLAKPIDEQELVAQICAMTRLKAAHRTERQEKDDLAALVAERTAELQQELAVRRQVEAALRESERIFDLFLHYTPVHVFIKQVTATESRVVRASDSFQQMLGISGGDMMGKTMTELFPPELAAKIIADDWASMEKGEPVTLEEELNGRSYTTIKFPIAMEGKRLLAGYSMDITERVAMQRAANDSRRALLSLLEDQARDQTALADSEAFSRAILDSVVAEIAVLDRNGVIREINQPWRAFALENGIVPGQPAPHTGVGENYLAHCRCSAGWASDEAESALEGIQAVLDGRLPIFRLEYPCHSPEQQRWFSLSATPLETEGGGVVVAHTDITERKAAEAQLRKVSLAVEQSLESIVITNISAEIEYVNEALVQTTGYSREELIGRNPRIWQSGKTPRETYVSMWNALRHGQPWKGEFHNRKKDGSDYVEFAIITPLRQPDGSISHYVAVKDDITEKKRMGEELDRHRYHLEELLAERTAALRQARDQAEAANIA